MGLNTEDKILIEQRVTNDSKNAGIAYALWFFLWWAGAHRFYLGRTGSAIAMLVLSVVGIITAAIFVGVILLMVVGIWALVDAFLIPGIVREDREALRVKLTNDALVAK